MNRLTRALAVACGCGLSLAPLPLLAAGPGKTRLAVYDLKASPGLEKLGRRLTDELLVHLQKRTELLVIGERELEIMLSHEEERNRLTACEGEGSCLAK